MGYKMGCVTNKPRSCTGPLLEQSGLVDFFEVVVAGDDLAEAKPAPAPLLYAADQLHVGPQDCVVIGDSRNDVDAARAAGMAVLGKGFVVVTKASNPLATRNAVRFLFNKPLKFID